MNAPAAGAEAVFDVAVLAARPRDVFVNGERIPRDAIAQEAQNHRADGPGSAWTSAARALVVRELLLQAARSAAIRAACREDEQGRRETEEEALIRELIEREVPAKMPDEGVCRHYYALERARFRSADLYELSHILLPFEPGDAESRSSALRTAGELIDALQRDPGAFPRLAGEHSACPSAASGGNLGQIGPGQTVPEFERALASLPVGTVAREPVESRFGWHIVHLARRIGGEVLPFELVRDRIAAWLAERTHRAAVHRYIGQLVRDARIDGVSLEGPPAREGTSSECSSGP